MGLFSANYMYLFIVLQIEAQMYYLYALFCSAEHLCLKPALFPTSPCLRRRSWSTSSLKTSSRTKVFEGLGPCCPSLPSSGPMDQANPISWMPSGECFLELSSSALGLLWLDYLVFLCFILFLVGLSFGNANQTARWIETE